MTSDKKDDSALKDGTGRPNGVSHDKTKDTEDTPQRVVCDGNTAVAYASYPMNDMAYIFPITPSSPMAEVVDDWSSQGKLNLFNQELQVKELQSEAGAAGALHGALTAGSLATTFTASQGLLLYIPNLYKMSGELLPTVIHVASRALAGQALSIYGDHSDTMLVRGCGLAMISSFSVQEAHDMAVVSQCATLLSRIPFLHFFDGFRTSHEVQRIEVCSDTQLKEMMPWEAIEKHRQRARSPLHPDQRGTAQAPDVFMQLVESSNSYYEKIPGIVEECFDKFYQVTGRRYNLIEYEYYGTTTPKYCIVTMGSSVQVVSSALKHIKSETTCLLGVRLFRPWKSDTFAKALPESVKRIAVLDRTREGGSQGEPLYLDVCTSLQREGRDGIAVAGGRYGLGSKDFTPRMVEAVISNLARPNVQDIQRPFTVGIEDDVTHLSLSLGKPVHVLPPDDVQQCVFWGFGSDGTVGGNKEAIKIIGNSEKDMNVQAYFEYDAKKSSGWTVSHLRFSSTHKIAAPWCVEDGEAHYVACHNESYVQSGKFDVVKYCKRGGTFFLNTTIASLETPEARLEALEKLVSPKILRTLALRRIRFYIMDAASLAAKFGLAGRINMICMCVFFKLAGVLPVDKAVELLKKAIVKAYSYKGDDVVKKNIDLLDAVVSDPKSMMLVDIPAKWRMITREDRSQLSRHIDLIEDEKTKKFMNDIAKPVSRLEGGDIPISKFLENHLLGGVMIPGTTRFEKRNPNPSNKMPEWNFNSCTQCNQCVFVCPHAAIRPFVVTRDEAAAAPFPKEFITLKGSGAELNGKRYSLLISPLDCTGCNACVEACPETPKALQMKDIEDFMPAAEKNWEYAVDLPERGDLVDKTTVRGSQFQTPLMEFSGACSGCGETPYFKLLTQLFGERMLITNATGCSSIWGGSFPANPYTVSKKTGRGPAWANSLFEDNAEAGLGVYSASEHRRERLVQLVQDYVHVVEQRRAGDEEKKQNDEELALLSLLSEWLEIRDEKSDKCTLLFDAMKPLFHAVLPEPEAKNHTPEASLLSKIWSERDMFPKISHWIVGGDGWAYDIGFGGLDHMQAFASNDVNVLVVDTEMYSNTGGQASKSTPIGAAVKFAMGGKQQTKKNLGEIFMTYEHVYVASVALSNQAQVLQAFVEADRHKGPSIILAYAPCIQQQVRPSLNDMFDESRLAVETGYWPLYRFNPALAEEGQNPFILDSKKLRKDVSKFLMHEGRFINLQKKNPTLAKELFAKMNTDVHHRLEHLNEKAAGYKAFDHEDDATVRVLFASETGTAARVARDFAAACTLSHNADALDDADMDDLHGKTTVFVVATCGQGAMPQNGKRFFKELCERTEPFPENTRFMMIGLGDSSYYFFCKAASDIREQMTRLGATELLSMGTADDSDEGGMEEGLHKWLDDVWPALEVPPPSEVPHIIPVKALFSERAMLRAEEDERAIRQFYESKEIQAVQVPILENELMLRPDYNRDFRRIIFPTKLDYELGDALSIFPENDPTRVSEFLHDYSPDFDERTVVAVHAWGIDGDISLGRLFTSVLDVFGKPSKHFMQQLATFEEDEEERKLMLEPDFLQRAAKETGITVADVLLRFKKAHPPLPALLAMIPVIKPRDYSIASAPLATPETTELCVLIDTWWCDAGMRYGLNCDMLRKKKKGDHVWCRMKAGSMEPPTPDQPVVCAGIGSGLAPHLAFLRDRVRAAEAGEEVAPFSLYFGNRFRADEFIYQEELEGLAEKYPNWFKLHTAFSRDGPRGAPKVYVQHLVGQTDDARLLLREQPGMLYICGNRNLPKPMQENMIKSFTQGSEDESEIAAATAVMEDMFVHGRAQQEVW